MLPIGYFANVIELNGVGLALCTDGVGSKTIIADLMRKYDTIGIDCVAMNVNDMICVGAKPLSTGGLHRGLAHRRRDARCDRRRPVQGGRDGRHLDLGRRNRPAQGCGHRLRSGRDGSRLRDLDKVIDGSAVREGDVVIGVRSNGIHSNGLSLARKAFFENQRYPIERRFDELSGPLGEELLRPTDIYVPEALQILREVRGLKALVNITGDGLLNLVRVAADVGFVIDSPIEPHPIFALIQRHAEVDDSEMYEVFNMGLGFCYVVDPADADLTLSILQRHGRSAQRIGHAVADAAKSVRIPGRGLLGRHKRFSKEDRAAGRAR